MTFQKSIFSYYEHLKKKLFIFYLLISNILFEKFVFLWKPTMHYLKIFFCNIYIFTVTFEQWNSSLLNINIYIVKKKNLKKPYWLQTFEW